MEYIFDDSISSLSQTGETVNVTFKHAKPRTFDLVIGADGLHSNVRSLAFGDETKFIRNLGCYVSIFTMANHMNLDHAGSFYGERGRIAGIFSSRHNKEATVSFYFTSPPLAYDRYDITQQQRIIAEIYKGMDWEVPRLLEAMQEAPDFYFDSISQIKMDRWSTGRIALLGDAAYCGSPLSGMGTGMAVVGAYVLAGELKDAGGDYRLAFAQYEKLMRTYVEGCQKIADGAPNGSYRNQDSGSGFSFKCTECCPIRPGRI